MNVDGYYNSLLSFLDLAVDEEFISRNARCIIVSAPTAKELVRNLEVDTYYITKTHFRELILANIPIANSNSNSNFCF